jgi:periplasmic divalent cation tolerance protein
MAQVLLYVTASDVQEAAKIARTLVKERLVACANVLGAVRSFYRWEGEIQDDEEAVLIAKTGAERVEETTARIKALHSYDVPCVVAVPLVGGNEEFLTWIASETGASD